MLDTQTPTKVLGIFLLLPAPHPHLGHNHGSQALLPVFTQARLSHHPVLGAVSPVLDS